MNIDIICPLYNAENYIQKQLKQIEKQTRYNDLKNIRYIITESKDSTIEIVKNLKENNEKILYKVVKREDFSHSLTREMEVKESTADIIVFITQDIKIEKNDWLENLIKPIENGEVDATYSRQICNDKSSIEYYTRQKNYPEKSKIVSKEDITKLGLNTFFFSDASSAIRKSTFVELKGYDSKNFPTNEDMYIAYKLIINGYKIKYCADSEVIHSHKFTLKQQYKRYYDTGKFFKQNSYLDNYKVNRSGLNLAKYVLKRAWKDKNFGVIFGSIPNMAARYIGMKKGKRRKK